MFSNGKFSLIDRNNCKIVIGQEMLKSEEMVFVVQGDVTSSTQHQVCAGSRGCSKPEGVDL